MIELFYDEKNTKLPVLKQPIIKEGQSTYEHSSNTTTTEKEQHILANPQKIKGFSLVILDFLKDFGKLTAIEIKDKTNKSIRYINVYLYRLEKYKIIIRGNDWKWYINEPLNDYIIYNIYRYNRCITDEQHLYNRFSSSVKQNQHRVKHSNFQEWCCEHSEFEVVVVDYLLSHYNKTSSKYVYSTDFDCEKLGLSPNDLKDTIAKLRRDAVVYTFVDNIFHKLKVGLKDSFIESMNHQQNNLQSLYEISKK